MFDHFVFVLEEPSSVFDYIQNELLLFILLPLTTLISIFQCCTLFHYMLQQLEIPQLNKYLIKLLIRVHIKHRIDYLASELLQLTIR